ncbi:hypothetical protein JCM11491_001245 [Sporobolomyces phaffii]
MEVTIEGGLPLKHFVRALTCLTRFGEELDFLVTATRCSISTVNSSRTAFAVVHLYPSLFDSYALLVPPTPSPSSSSASSSTSSVSRRRGETPPYKFSVSGKALLSPLRPKNAGTIESCTIRVGSDAAAEDDHDHDHDDDHRPRRTRLQPGVVDAGECRIVIRLHCQHGLVKTHRLTYSGPNVNNWARFDRDACTARWKASSKVLRDWTDHFYLRTNPSGGATMTDEITFYCTDTSCRLKSFVDTSSEQNMSDNEIMASRPLTTELSVDTEDFDMWDLPDPDPVVITFALKEFKAVINLSEALSLPITCHFTRGGRPLMIEVEGDHLEAKFVVATTDYDSAGGGSGVVKQQSASGEERSVKRELGAASASSRGAARTSNHGDDVDRGARLFNPAPTPTPGPAPASAPEQQRDDDDGDDDGFDWGGFDDTDAAFAQIDHLSQQASSSARPPARVLVPDTSEPTRSGPSSTTTTRRKRFEEDEEFGLSPAPEELAGPLTDETVLGPTQRYSPLKKKSKWNILDDE